MRLGPGFLFVGLVGGWVGTISGASGGNEPQGVGGAGKGASGASKGAGGGQPAGTPQARELPFVAPKSGARRLRRDEYDNTDHSLSATTIPGRAREGQSGRAVGTRTERC